jgi:hypothetical protein
MSDKSKTYLRLNSKEAQALLRWFLFQEHANTASYEENEDSTITTEEVALLNRIRSCVKRMADEPKKYSTMRLSPEYCQIVFDWYTNIPSCLTGDIDADIHANLGMFLNDLKQSED